MNKQPFRLIRGGRINRARPIPFRFDGREFGGYAGDTLASALVANGIKTVARSFKYHRRRGIVGAGAEEPNALVTLLHSSRGDCEPNALATAIELADGLNAESQNRIPSLEWDVGAAINCLSPLFPAGFYYKTFFGKTPKAWMFWEKFIRYAAGLGRAPNLPDSGRYERIHDFCDVLVVGGGGGGLAAALAAARCGARVVLAERQFEFGGGLLHCKNDDAEKWRQESINELKQFPEVRLLSRANVFGGYDGGVFGIAEECPPPSLSNSSYGIRRRFRIMRARYAVVATGAIERPLVFERNDLPGVMLADSARAYANRWAALPGRRIAVFTNNDSAYAAAMDLKLAGAEVTLIDARTPPPPSLSEKARGCGIELIAGRVVVRARGIRGVKSIDVAAYDSVKNKITSSLSAIPCDLLCVSGGWSPTVHLVCQRGINAFYDKKTAAHLVNADAAKQNGILLAGSACGDFALADCINKGFAAGTAAAKECGFLPSSPPPPPLNICEDERWESPILPLWEIPVGARAKKFVDFQHDVSAADIALACREGYENAEHLKRYTTIGMATDQGKTGGMNALGILAKERGDSVDAIAPTTFRPPYSPVSIGAVAGDEFGERLAPERLSPMHRAHEKRNAVFADAGLWKRPRYFPRSRDETLDQAAQREATQTRSEAGVFDISTLGKIELHGRGGGDLLQIIYANNWRTLPVGRARYGVMLRDDGIAFDDGTAARLGEHRYFITTTTAHAAGVLSYIEFLLQIIRPRISAHAFDVTDEWAAFAVAGPKSRDVLSHLSPQMDFSKEAIPFMGISLGNIGGIPLRAHRVSYSGELAFEIYTPSKFGEELWTRIIEGGGGAARAIPCGLEAMNILRIEKGHIAGPELDGRTTLADLNLSRLARKDGEFTGGALMRREGLQDSSRPSLAGFIAENDAPSLRAGAILFNPQDPQQGHGIGRITSAAYSPTLKKRIALGFIVGGLSREGEIVHAAFPLKNETVPVKVASPSFFDPEGNRARG